jgi:DNA-binding PadR family transcriptional regulator
MATDEGRDLLILGILRRSPMSAYALNRVVRAHVPLYRPFKYGNVYHALERLASRGYLLGKDVKAKRGPRDSKTVFRLSALGERHFHRLLTGLIADVQTDDPTLEIAYVLLGQLPRHEALALLLERAKSVAEQERRLVRIVGDVDGREGAGYIAMSHTRERLVSERRFLAASAALLKDPKWNPDWVMDDGPIRDPARKL